MCSRLTARQSNSQRYRSSRTWTSSVAAPSSRARRLECGLNPRGFCQEPRSTRHTERVGVQPKLPSRDRKHSPRAANGAACYKISMLPAGFEPASEARKAPILDRTRLRERNGRLVEEAINPFGAAVSSLGANRKLLANLALR